MSSRPSRPWRLMVFALACWAGVTIARLAIRGGDGLTAQYYSNPTFTAPVAFTTADTDISTDVLTRRWQYEPPSTFSTRWIGYLAVGATATYDFAITSDDGAQLYVDNQLIVDNSGAHGAVVRNGNVPLARGPHLISLEYTRDGATYALEWSWAREGAAHAPIPAWALSQRRTTYEVARLGWALGWLSWIAAGLTALAGLLMVHRAGLDRAIWRQGARRPRAACLLLFVGLTVLETWPLASDPGHLSRNDNGDTLLNEWTLAWVAHQAPRAPTQLFQANIFHPEPNTLAFSEALLVQSAFAAPILWLGASPVLAYNVVLMLGFALTGWAMCCVVARWTSDWPAGVAAGILMAFNAHTLTRLPHMQAQHVEFLPLALLALDALLRQPRLRHAASLAVWFTLQSLASYYLFVMTALGMAAAVLSRPESFRGKQAFGVVRYLVVAAGLASLVLLPYLFPYWRAHSGQGLTRTLDAILPTFWQDYLTTPARFDYWLLERWTSSTGLFPGFLGLALTGYAIAKGALKDPLPRMCLVFGLCGVVLSFGSVLPGYALLYRAFPPLAGIRALSRFGYLGIVAVAILGGYGVAMLRHASRPALARVAGVVIPLAVMLESLAAPIGYTPFTRIPSIYHRLDDVPSAVVADLPLAVHQYIFANAPAMLNSTTSFYRLLNGYSGFIPQSYLDHYDTIDSFPSAAAIAALRGYGVTHVFVHADAYPPEQRNQIRRAAGLRQLADDGTVALYEVRTGF